MHIFFSVSSSNRNFGVHKNCLNKTVLMSTHSLCLVQDRQNITISHMKNIIYMCSKLKAGHSLYGSINVIASNVSWSYIFRFLCPLFFLFFFYQVLFTANHAGQFSSIDVGRTW